MVHKFIQEDFCFFPLLVEGLFYYNTTKTELNLNVFIFSFVFFTASPPRGAVFFISIHVNEIFQLILKLV